MIYNGKLKLKNYLLELILNLKKNYYRLDINIFVYFIIRDGQLKRMKPKKEWREKQQEEFSKRLKVE